MKTLNSFRNDLMKRQEIKVEIDSEKNPGFSEAQKKIAQHFKSEEDRVVVKKISGKFGLSKFDTDAFVYDSAKDKEMLEPKKKEKKTKAEGAN